MIGDVMALAGAFLYALSNILQEHFLKSREDVHHYLGFLGLFGTIITFLECYVSGEFDDVKNLNSD